MAKEKRARLSRRFRELGGEVAEMIELRRRLAEAEIRSDLVAGKRLAIAAGIGTVIAVVGISLLTVVLAGRADAALQSASQTPPEFPHISFWLGLLLSVAGAATVIVEIRRFRKDFSGLWDSIAELKEDILWLREWCDGDEMDDPE